MSAPDRLGRDAERERPDLLRALPYGRRYARALSGAQDQGDALVAEALRRLLGSGATAAAEGQGARLALYGAIGDAFATTARASEGNGLSQVQRMLLLLTSLEELPAEAAAIACRIPAATAALELRLARNGLRDAIVARVLIIEDEPIIALDIQELVERCGHHVIGIAATEADAVMMAQAERPELVLADINLGAGGDGVLAVSRILRFVTAPVVFVTAYPKRLLTGEAVEPAFIITKPFEPATLAVATYQAVTRGIRPV